jgi:hypothetical protein
MPIWPAVLDDNLMLVPWSIPTPYIYWFCDWRLLRALLVDRVKGSTSPWPLGHSLSISRALLNTTEAVLMLILSLHCNQSFNAYFLLNKLLRTNMCPHPNWQTLDIFLVPQLLRVKDLQPSHQEDSPSSRTGCFEHSTDILRNLQGNQSLLSKPSLASEGPVPANSCTRL